MEKLQVGSLTIKKIKGHERAITTYIYTRSLIDGTKEVIKKLENLECFTHKGWCA